MFFLPNVLFGQDIHYSQVGNSPQNINPGLTGVFNGNDRIIANFRNQWHSVPVDYLQLSAAYDHRFSDKKFRPTPFAAGFTFNHDSAGDLGLSLTQVGLSGSYAHRLISQKNHFLSFGVNAGLNQRRFDPNEGIWDEQYDFKDGVNLGIPTTETFDNTTKSYASLGIGANLRLQPDSTRTKFDIGVAMFHLNEPDKSFTDGPQIRLERRLSIFASAAFQIADKFDLLVHAMSQFQEDYHEVVFGAGGLYHLNQMKTQELAIEFGIYHRVQDAIIPWVGVHWNAWKFTLSYDVNSSQFRQASARRGGPEFSVIYIIKYVPPMEYCELCPKFM